jgi:hypothetical protein
MRCTLSIDRLQAGGVAPARAKSKAMTKHVASRTLVKSPPELWVECSDATSLARHLDQFGEIRITRLEPETAVAWEGERARGTVRIEPSGWGTKVILTAVAVEEEPVSAEPVSQVAAEAPEAPVEEEPVFAEPEPLEHPEPPVAAEAPPQEPDLDPVAVTEPVEASEPIIDAPARRRRFARLFGFFKAPPREPVLLVESAAVEEPRPDPEPEAEPALEAEPDLTPQPEAQAEPEPEPVDSEAPASIEAPANTEAPAKAEAPANTETPATEAALTSALDSLGQAHHRPYSRA